MIDEIKNNMKVLIFFVSENLYPDNKNAPIANMVKLSFKIDEFQNREEGSKNKPKKNHSSLFLKMELNNLKIQISPIVDKNAINTVFISG